MPSKRASASGLGVRYPIVQLKETIRVDVAHNSSKVAYTS